jgi:hypothetical protein
MSLTSYRAAPSRATNKATLLSPGSLFCFPDRFRVPAAGCSIPRHQLQNRASGLQKKKKATAELSSGAAFLKL